MLRQTIYHKGVFWKDREYVSACLPAVSYMGQLRRTTIQPVTPFRISHGRALVAHRCRHYTYQLSPRNTRYRYSSCSDAEMITLRTHLPNHTPSSDTNNFGAAPTYTNTYNTHTSCYLQTPLHGLASSASSNSATAQVQGKYICDLLKSCNAVCVCYQYKCIIHDVLFYEILYCHFACNAQEMQGLMLSAPPPQPPKMPGITFIYFRLMGYNAACAVYMRYHHMQCKLQRTPMCLCTLVMLGQLA